MESAGEKSQDIGILIDNIEQIIQFLEDVVSLMADYFSDETDPEYITQKLKAIDIWLKSKDEEYQFNGKIPVKNEDGSVSKIIFNFSIREETQYD